MAKPTHELIAETAREMGILLTIFGPLEALLKSNSPQSSDFFWATFLVIGGCMLMIAGIALEAS
jgi:hypothetical protein